jgi:hypothetical protein
MTPSPDRRSTTLHAVREDGALPTGEPERCPETGRQLPECGCSACGLRLVARYAPHIAAA